jgi:(E)-4-hydroxy-3-methylbut-2-enyl-diphosphate synthase
MSIERRRCTHVTVGSVVIGANAPIAVQSMTNTDTRDVPATLGQIQRLAAAGCEIVRVAIRHQDVLNAFEEIALSSPLPVVADVHFDHVIAVEAARRGAAKLRINPGNIGDMGRVDEVIDAAGEAGIPIRIGVNAGSLASEFAERDWPLADKLAASAVAFAEHFSQRGFTQVVLSAKASSVRETIAAYRILGRETAHPLHIGVTEAGTALGGAIKSAVGLGVLLEEGIGDTLRVSLTADPVEEVTVGWEILASLDIRRRSPELISCPTCGRCRVDLIPIAEEVEARLRERTIPIKVAVMGCEVNGPGEARDADVGVACGLGTGIVFARGETIAKVSEDRIVDALFDAIDEIERSR